MIQVYSIKRTDGRSARVLAANLEDALNLLRWRAEDVKEAQATATTGKILEQSGIDAN